MSDYVICVYLLFSYLFTFYILFFHEYGSNSSVFFNLMQAHLEFSSLTPLDALAMRSFLSSFCLDCNQSKVLLFANIIQDSAARVIRFGFVRIKWSSCPKTLSAKQDVFGTPFKLFFLSGVKSASFPPGNWSLYSLLPSWTKAGKITSEHLYWLIILPWYKKRIINSILFHFVTKHKYLSTHKLGNIFSGIFQVCN